MKTLHKYLLRRDLAKAINRKRKVICRRLTRDVYRDQQALFDQARVTPSVIMDVGAFVGEITARYHNLFPDAAIYAIEPYPKSFSQLKARFANEQKIQMYSVAASDQAGLTQFYVGYLPNNNSLLPQKNLQKPTIDIETVTLDGLAKKLSLNHIDILKIDTEGGEFKVLMGAQKLLSTMDIDLISAEVRFQMSYIGEALFPEVVMLLNEHGYTLHNLYVNRENNFRQAEYGDATFLSSAFRERLKISR